MTVPEALAAAIEYAAKNSVTEASLARGQCCLRARHMQSALDRDGHEVWILEVRPCRAERQQDHHFAVLVPSAQSTLSN